MNFSFVLLILLHCLLDQVNTQATAISNNSNVTSNVTKVYYNTNEPPKPGQKSLLIIFDGTVSMTQDLRQVRIAARDIINYFSSRPENSIYNYVLVVFRDPDIEDAINTKDPNDLIRHLDLIVLDSRRNPDCPEMALSGMNKALQYALPLSYAFVFTDAAAKDYELANITKQLIQATQTTMNFITTAECDMPESVMNKIYKELAGKQGQVFLTPRKSLADVVSNLKDQLDKMFAKVKSINVGIPGTRDQPFFVDSTMSNIRISLTGKNPKIIIQDPNKTFVTTQDLTLDDLKFVEINNPLPGKWQLTASSESNFSLRVGSISTVRFDFGFSQILPSKSAETLFQPLKGKKNILSLFASNPELLKSLTSVTVISNNDKKRRKRQIEDTILPLKKINDVIYVTEPHEFANELCSLQLNGVDLLGNQMERLLSAAIQSSDPILPQILNEVTEYEFVEHKPAIIYCKVKSQIALKIQFFHGDEIIEEMESLQSNEFELKINRILLSDAGNYTCKASNDIGEVESDIMTVNILAKPRVCRRMKLNLKT